MSSPTLPDPETDGVAASPEILSDEEIRARAAAYAQQIYESQLEAYKAQREQVLAARRAQEDYERQRAAYEEACRSYYAQQQAQPAVRVDPETGEQVYAGEASQAENADAEVEGETEANDANAEVFSEETETPPEAEDASEEFSEETEFADVPAESAEPADAAPEAVPEAESEENPPPLPEPPAVLVAPPFPLIRVFIVIVCLAIFSAEGYILFSEDPRFETQRNRFFTAIGWENAVTNADAETRAAAEEKAKAARALPDYPRPQKVAEPAAEEPPAVSDAETETAEAPDDADEIFSDEEFFEEDEETDADSDD